MIPKPLYSIIMNMHNAIGKGLAVPHLSEINIY